MAIDELLIDFDEMGFVPTTLCENPDEYAQDWKKQLLVEIKRLKAENARLTEKLKKETAKEILQEWADDNSSMGLDNTFVKNIAKKYGVEVKE